MNRDKDGFELKIIRRVWWTRLGYIGDSEGRTWALELRYDKAWPTETAAKVDLANHPETKIDKWGGYRTIYDNGQCGVFYSEEPVFDLEILT